MKELMKWNPQCRNLRWYLATLQSLLQVRMYGAVPLMLLLFSHFTTAFTQTQQQAEQSARKELEARGITEDELRQKLSARGIDLDQLENLSPEQALAMQSEIERAIEEIERERGPQARRPAAPSAVSHRQLGLAKQLDTTKAIVANELSPVSDRDTSKKFALTSGDPERIWGHHLFQTGAATDPPPGAEVQAPDSYRLGPGDVIAVSIWGMSQHNEVYELGTDGSIVPDRLPRIFLKGMPLAKARALLKSQFGRYYRFNENQFDVALNRVRTINVNLFGEVVRSGGISLSATNTAVNALAAAGGLTSIGSVRNMILVRNGRKIPLDLYRFLSDPATTSDVYLEHNDLIQVPVAGKVVRIQGAVSRPMRYELIEGEGLLKLIAYAGGLRENAITQTLQIERFENDRRTLLDVPLDALKAKGGDFALRHGDQVTIYSIRTEAEEYVYVRGAVRVEASYRFEAGMKLSQLLSRVALLPESNTEIAFLRRNHPDGTASLLRINLRKVIGGSSEDDAELRGGDELIVYRAAAFVDRAYVSIQGAVRQEGTFQFDPSQDTRLKDLLLMAGGLRNDAFQDALLYRRDDKSLHKLSVIRVDVQDLMSNDAAEQNVYLQPYDSLVVLSEGQFEESRFVEISGAVRQPGRYAFGNGLTAADLVALAQGFTYFAAPNRIDVFRVVMRNDKPTQTVVSTLSLSADLQTSTSDGSYVLEPFDLLVVRAQPEFQLQQVVQLEGEFRYPGPYALINPNERMSDLVFRAGGLSAEAFAGGATLYRTMDSIGYVVVDLATALKERASNTDILLKQGDLLYVPKQKDLVRIAGATNAGDLYPDKLLAGNNAINVAFEHGKSAKYYIDRYAAGISKAGDLDKITVEHPNGRIDRTRSFLFFNIYPKVSKGSVINVGYKDPKAPKAKSEKKDIDWSKVVADSIAQATAVLSLILLIDRLK